MYITGSNAQMLSGELATLLSGRYVKIERELFGKNSLLSILRNEKYTGVYVYNLRSSKDASGKRNNNLHKPDEEMIRAEGGVPTIVPIEEFQAVQELLNKRKTKTSTRKNTIQSYLLTGKIKCGICGGRF